MPEFGLMTPRDEVFPELSPQVTAALADRLITFDTDAHSAPSTVSSSRHHWLQTWLTAAAVLLLSVLGAGWWIIGSASPAQAWSAVPIDLTAQQTAAAVRTCQRGGASQSVAGAVEGRGRSVYVLFTDSTQCLLLTGSDAAAITPPTFTPHPGEVTGLDVNLLWTGPLSATHPAAITPEPGQRSALVGQVGADVRSVRINLADGSSLTATVSNGWVIAWWPGTAAATGLAATDAHGQYQITVVPGTR